MALLAERGVRSVGPTEGDMACGEYGFGRLAEPEDIVAAIDAFFRGGDRLRGTRALVTSGPTHEAIDPVRYIANRSSGRQGHAIAAALARLGAETTLVAGPTGLADPPGVRVVHVESADDMLAACQAALPVDVAVCAAAVADWKVPAAKAQKLKKEGAPPRLELAPNPDILAGLSAGGPQRPALVVGFAAETENVVEHATAKRARKGCDWILANDVAPASGTFGGARNRIHLIDDRGVESWPEMTKTAVAAQLAERIAEDLAAGSGKGPAARRGKTAA
jgi:phosphopantothenoylcysteine decarboxylase/phosphopantothenate--cysteine ligase